MRPALRRPEDSDFVPANEYETSAPASFGLPELPVLYALMKFPESTVWIASNGAIIWNTATGTVYDLDEVTITEKSIALPDQTLEIGTQSAQELYNALMRCRRMVASATAGDSIELAVPVDYETGDADDLGDSRLVQSVSEGICNMTRPTTAYKRRRSE